MSNNIEEEHLIGPIIRNDKNFIYKGKKYPISFESVKSNSNYFYINSDEFKGENIELQIEIEISEDTIKSFINCCHNEKFKINEANVFQLDYLSKKYEVPKLTRITQEYISRPNTNLAFQSLLFKNQLRKNHQQLSVEKIINDTSKEEEIICERLIEFLNEEQFIDLPIPFIDRILKKYLKDNKEEESINKIVEFLFKCLDKHHRKASVLFLNIDMENQPKDLVVRLLNDYGEIFDFNMINLKSLLNTTSELLKELIKVKKEYSKNIQEMKEIIKEQKNEIKQFNKFRNFVDNEFKEVVQKQKDIIESQKAEIDKIKEELKNELKSFITKQTQIVETQKNKSNKIKEDLNLELKRFIEKQNQINETQKNECNKIKENLYSDLKRFIDNKITEEHQIIMNELNRKASTQQIQNEFITKSIPFNKFYKIYKKIIYLVLSSFINKISFFIL